MEGAQGTNPGANPTDEFKARLLEVNPDLKDFNYGPESYDATILAALAAVKGGANDGPTVQANMAAVSGTTDGEECATFADCVALLKDGKEITYQAVSGVGPFNDNNTRRRRSSASTSTTPRTCPCGRRRSSARSRAADLTNRT